MTNGVHIHPMIDMKCLYYVQKEHYEESLSTYHSVPRTLSFLPDRESRPEPEPEPEPAAAAAAAEAKLDGICEGILNTFE